MTIVRIHDAKTSFSKLLVRAHMGEGIIIAKAENPYARLLPLLDMKEKRSPRIAKGAVTDAFSELLPDVELARWES